MPVDPDLDWVGEVRADLDERGPEVDVPQVEVEARDPPVGLGEGEPRGTARALALRRGEHVLVLLRDSDRRDPGATGSRLRGHVTSHDVTLALLLSLIHISEPTRPY